MTATIRIIKSLSLMKHYHMLLILLLGSTSAETQTLSGTFLLLAGHMDAWAEWYLVQGRR